MLVFSDVEVDAEVASEELPPEELPPTAKLGQCCCMVKSAPME